MVELIILADAVLIAVLGGMGRQLARIPREFSLPKSSSKPLPETKLPSVTVCMPARNEDHALTDSLQEVLRSEYPKLEIIVLDDASSDNTTALIKSFASEGVRFVAGSPLQPGWLGKNHALAELLDEASGSYVFFMDVDTHMRPFTLRTLVEHALANKLDMISVLPRRNDGLRASVLLSPLRFFWEVMFHRASSPASANNAWLIKREVLEGEFNGFETLKATVKPELHIAAALNKRSAYQFIVGSSALGISHQKKWRSQLATSVRLLYPRLGGKWWLVVAALLDLMLMMLPFSAVALGLAGVAIFSPQSTPVLFWLNAAVALGYCVLYALYTKRVWAKGWYLGAFLWPVLAFQEMILLAVSFIRYKRGTVTWKGRPVQWEDQN